jgi:hypothetical protein
MSLQKTLILSRLGVCSNHLEYIKSIKNDNDSLSEGLHDIIENHIKLSNELIVKKGVDDEKR